MSAEQYVSLGFAVVLLTVVVWFVIRHPLPSPFQYTVFRILLALGCACVAVFLTGFLSVELTVGIKAGGAFAVFIVIYRFAPAAVPDLAAGTHLISAYTDLRAIDPQSPNQEDVSRAISAVNEAGTLLQGNPTVRAQFLSARGHDFKVLYDVLTKNKIPVPHMNSTSDQLINQPAHELARSLDA